MNTGYSRKYKLFAMLLSLTAAILIFAGFQSMVARASSAIDENQAPVPVSPILAEKVIVVNVTGTVNIIDTANDIVYGPYLSGTLGSPGGSTLDVAVTPDGNKALISNFGDSAVYIVDIRDPLNPSVIISATMPMFAEDIAISPDGRFALVTDGGFNPYVATIDLISNSLIYTTSLGSRNTNAVAIAPNGTVVGADYFAGDVHAMLLSATGELTYTASYSYTVGPDGSVSENATTSAPIANLSNKAKISSVESPDEPLWALPKALPSPVNIAIAPDGQTVLVCNASPYTSTTTYARFDVGVYRITAPGVLSFKGAITGLNRAAQSIAFSPAGDRAYLAGNGGSTDDMSYDQLAVLEITGPGDVHLLQNGVADYPRLTGSQLFGVDTITVGNGKAYLGFPTISGASNDIRIVNLNDFSVMKRTVSGIPTGIATIPLKKIYLPLLLQSTP